MQDQQIGKHEVQEAPQTMTVEDDKPLPGGLANGVWKARPEIPLPMCGTLLARNAPPKKYANISYQCTGTYQAHIERAREIKLAPR